MATYPKNQSFSTIRVGLGNRSYAVKPGYTCGWCHERVDLDHITQCRLDEGESSRHDFLAFERARNSALIEEVRSWITEEEPVLPVSERSTFVISLDHRPEDLLEAMLDIGEYAEKRYPNVTIDLLDETPET